MAGAKYIGVPGPHPHAEFYRFGFRNVGLRPSKSPKILIFGINLPLRKNQGVHREKLNIGAQKPSSMQQYHNCFENYTAS